MRVLVVGERGREVVEACAIAAGRGAEVRHRARFADALADLRSGRGADLLLVDLELDIGAIVRALAQERIWLPVVAYGIGAEPRAAVAAIRAGAKEFIPLPPDPELIAAVIASLAADERELVSEDPAMLAVLDLARHYAPAEASVLITGESGTGKKLWPGLSIATAAAPMDPSFLSTAQQSLSSSLKANCSATSVVRLPVPSLAVSASSRRQAGVPCYLMRSARWSPGSRPSCCAPSRNARSTASAARVRSRSTFASSRRATATCSGR